MSTRRLTYAIGSCLVTGAVFLYLFSHVSPGAVVELVASADRGAVAMFVALSLGMSFVRTWRYRLFLEVSGFRPPGLPLFLIVLVRNLFVDLLPARIGSLVYIYLVRERLGVALAPATSSFALSLVFDVLAQAPILILAVLFAGRAGGVPVVALAGVGLGLAVSGVGLLAFLPRLLALVGGATRIFPASLHERCEAFVLRIRADVEKTSATGVYSRALVLSVLIRLTKYAALYVFLYALLAPRGYGLADLGVAKVLIGTMAAEAAASLPISGIAGFGAYEGTWAAVFQLLGFPGDVAKLTSIAHHLFTQAWGYGLGGLALLVLVLPIFGAATTRSFRPPDAMRPSAPWPRFAAQVLALVVLLVGSLALAREIFPPRETAAAAAPTTLDEPARAALAPLAARFPGRIVFDSNRGGSFGIHSIGADGGNLRAIVDGPAEEMYPDPSPDGRHVVFARQESTWRMAPSDVWIVDADGSNARKLVEDGTFPTFAADGKRVYFERGRAEVWVVEVAGSDPRRLFAPDALGFGGHAIVKPRVSPDGRGVLFTSDRAGRWNAWGVDLESRQAFHVGRGCEPAWTTDPRHVLWVRGGDSRSGSGIYQFDRESGETASAADAGPPIGTEYFPTVTRDGRYLLYAASPESERSHVDGSFALFVKDLASGEVFQLTRDSHTNRWPKLLPTAG